MSVSSRRRFLTASAAALATGALAPRAFSAAPSTSRPASSPWSIDESAFTWTDVRDWGVEGKGFSDTEGDYDRLPKRASGVVRGPVWNLSRDSTGMSVSFRAETPSVAVRYTLLKESIAMPHMPATGVSGADLYAKDGQEKWRWVGVTRPATQRVSASLVKDMDVVVRDYRLYFPLYNGVKKLEVGVPRGTEVTPVAPRTEGSVVYYGTSIAQGGCVSRPGMSFTSILSRWLDRPFLNMAFSGNGKMEENVGRFLVELDPALWVIDCLPNMTAAEVAERTEPLVKQLRKARPDTPILLVEDRTNDAAWTSKKALADRDERRKNLHDAYERLLKAGQKRLHYLKGDHLTGDDGEGTVDGSHPTDLGAMRYADQLLPAIKKALA